MEYNSETEEKMNELYKKVKNLENNPSDIRLIRSKSYHSKGFLVNYAKLSFSKEKYNRTQLWDTFILPLISKSGLESLVETSNSLICNGVNNIFHSRYDFHGSRGLSLTIRSPKFSTFLSDLKIVEGRRVKVKLKR